MGRTSRRRRRAALREQDRRRTDGARTELPREPSGPDPARRSAGTTSTPGYSPVDLVQIVLALARLASGGESQRYLLDRRLRELIDAMAAPAHWAMVAEAVDGRLASCVVDAQHRGWEQADLVHAARQLVSVRAARLVAGCSAEKPPGEQQFDPWRIAESLDHRPALSDAVHVIGLFSRLGPVPRPTVRTSTQIDEAMLAKVRALLAKAEATNFPAEAEAFTAKAQELMSRHAIDAAMVAASIDGFGRSGGAPGMAVRRVHLDDPYALQKAELLHVVADANDARSVFSSHVRIATLVGHASDLDLVELLFTSLLLQATQAMAEAGRERPADRSSTFRRSFFIAYSHRILERLAEAKRTAQEDGQRTYGAALVPVLRARSEQVEAAVTELFPNTRRSGGSNSIDPRGWAAGRAAADRADVAGRRGRLAS